MTEEIEKIEYLYLFIFIAIFIGVVSKIINKYANIPYTPLLLLFGLILGLVSENI